MSGLMPSFCKVGISTSLESSNGVSPIFLSMLFPVHKLSFATCSVEHNKEKLFLRLVVLNGVSFLSVYLLVRLYMRYKSYILILIIGLLN